MSTKRTLAVLLTAVLLSVGLTSPAQAEDMVTNYHGEDVSWALYGTGDNCTQCDHFHRLIAIDDREPDGNPVQVDYVMNFDRSQHYHLYDYTADNGGNHQNWDRSRIYAFRTCELFDSGRWGCTDWKYPQPSYYV